MDKLETELADGTVYLKRSYGKKLDEVRNALHVLHWFIFQKSQQNAAWSGVGKALDTLTDLEFNGSDWDLHEVAIKLGGKDGDHPDKGTEHDIGKDYIWSRKGEERYDKKRV